MVLHDIYTTYNIDKSKLKRDYIQHPLMKGFGGQSKGEKPFKEDLVYLYIELNLKREVLEEYFSRCSRTLKLWFKEYNIHKSMSLIHKNINQTNLKKYGVSCVLKDENIFKKGKKTLFKRYGVYNPSQCKQIIDKKYETKIYNKTYGTSKDEEKIYSLLQQKYPSTIRQYKSDLYPYACDFYIPEIDTYIEYNGFWTHGGEPYMGSEKQQEKLKLWESKNKPQYNKAINDWTVRDILKRKTAKNNNLNYLEFFNINQFNEWFVQF